VRELTQRGVTVLVETAAGAAASLPDSEYEAAGARIVPGAADAWSAELVVKVKEPTRDELAHLRPDLTLFTYLHLAAYPHVAEALQKNKTTALAYETVQTANGALPLLAPMSEIAGRLATQAAAHWLQRPYGGRGVLMGGAPGVRPARVVVIGAGNVGWNAAWIAAGMQAEVVLMDRNIDRLRHLEQIAVGRVTTLTANRGAIERSVADADVEDMVRGMKPGAVVVDVAVDQGGCIATTRETTHSDPVYEKHGVVHYAVGNMPGAVPYTSTYALTNATLPYVVQLATLGARAAVAADPALALGVNTVAGSLTHRATADALGATYVDPLGN
jgi:alanine dehydrogenase